MSEWQWLHEWEGRFTLLWKAPDLLPRLIARSKPEWFKAIDIDHVRATLDDLANNRHAGNLQAVILNGSHLLIFSIGGPWFAQGTWLIEQFFMRVGPGDEADAFAALELLAEDAGASHIIMATALARNDEALGKVYQRYGYTKQSTQYVKEAQWLQSAQSSEQSG